MTSINSPHWDRHKNKLRLVLGLEDCHPYTDTITLLSYLLKAYQEITTT